MFGKIYQLDLTFYGETDKTYVTHMKKMAFGNIYQFFHRSSQAIHKFYQHVFINIPKQLIIFRNDIIIYTVKNAIHKIYQMIPASSKCIDKINAPMNLFLTVKIKPFPVISNVKVRDKGTT